MKNHIKHLLSPEQIAQYCEAFAGRPAPHLPAVFWAIWIVDHLIENEVQRDGNSFIVPQHTPAMAARLLVLQTYYKLYPAKGCDPKEQAQFIWEVLGHIADHFQALRGPEFREDIEESMWQAYDERASRHNQTYALFEEHERESAFLPLQHEILQRL